MLRLYHRPKTGRPARVRWALEEAGAPYEWFALTPEEVAEEEHLQRQPLGRVPVLETEDGTLFESAALCLQVADTFPEAGLIPPPGTHERGLVYQWSIFAVTELEPAIIQNAAERIEAAVAALEAPLRRHEHIAGEAFTIADVIVGSTLAIGARLDRLPRNDTVDAYLAGLEERPAKQRAFEAWLEQYPPPR